MDILSEKITKLIFKKNIEQDIGEISLDSKMLKVLSALDGEKDIAAIAVELDIRIIDIKNVLSKLNKHKLILQVKQIGPTLGKDFFDFMESNLAEAMGPIAKMLIGDIVRDMGETIDAFPKDQAAELVRKISLKIFIDGKKQAFLMNMKSKLG